MAPLLPTPRNRCHIQACAVSSLHDDDRDCGLPLPLPATRGHHLRPHYTVALGESPQRRAKARGIEPVISFRSNTMPTRSCAITNPIDRGHRPCPPLLCRIGQTPKRPNAAQPHRIESVMRAHRDTTSPHQ